MVAWSIPREETEYNTSKAEMVTNFSQVAEMAVIWNKPLQESNYEPTKSAMVLVHHSPAPVPMDMRGLPIQEADYDQAKSLMVIPGPGLKTATMPPIKMSMGPKLKICLIPC